jgi:hypothetical protein
VRSDARVLLNARSPFVLLLALAGLLLLSAASAAAPARPSVSPLTSLNAVRAELGLRTFVRNPIADRLVAEIAARDTADRQPQVLDSQPGCAVCQVVFDGSGGSASPSRVYARRGGRGLIGIGLWRADWSAKRNLSVFFPAAALALDPRARTFSSARTPRGMLLIAVTIDPRATFRVPVRWPTGPVEPRLQLWLDLLVPPGTQGQPYLSERRGGEAALVAHPLADAPGLAGARLVGFGLNAVLAYGRTYSARMGRLSVPFETGTIPRAFRRRSWSFVSVAPRDRRAFLTIIGRTPRLLRRLVADIDGAVRIVGNGHACHIADACENEQEGVVTLSFIHTDSYVVLHELGHAVFDLGLDEPGRRQFLTEFVKAGWRGAGSTPPSEIFADQLAFYALGRVPRGIDAYSDRMYLPRPRFAALLRADGGYRPLSALGPLPR